MVFNSIQFIVFFIVVTTGYFLSPHKYRWILLLVASCVFYMAFVPVYILILGFTIVIDYFAGIYIAQASGLRRKYLLTISLAANIGILAVFKYFNFISINLTAVMQTLGWHHALPLLQILLPIGLSFHTFQAMSYTIEVYRRNQPPERHFGIYALYVMFYPQLVAGPIERPQNMIHQFYEKHPFNWLQVNEGFKRIIWGFFKKIVVADRAAQYVNAVYDNSNYHSGVDFALATIFFAIQIYCDFAGYADIAIGCAQVMGFKLMENFRRPYFAKTVSEFWRRWHISLSTWFTDYLYISLGGNRVKLPRAYLNLMIVFLISGLWHGADWRFMAWGAINGFYLIFAHLFQSYKDKLHTVSGLQRLGWFYAFLQIITTVILISFSWIFFRATSISIAIDIIKKIFTSWGHLFIQENIIYVLLGAGILFLSEFISEYYPHKKLFTRSRYAFVRCFSYAFIVILIMALGVFDGGQFIYFQF
ncbi:MBOAT family O-acyltransferase [Mucilaginibacter psychrotolerans]|uniref:MBOAT family protein n=1 Tax=Mucilaginibacter psychrotolerans TaxID=1524096 RepID=A0A4Y8SJE6_9SPHI|nr:MBOAT family O-acyltransferase [Mucilaginibacter psychrotolerans]TFF39193.1 MBOAT family protein [Mucilaginibacter psychrotolerans]